MWRACFLTVLAGVAAQTNIAEPFHQLRTDVLCSDFEPQDLTSNFDAYTSVNQLTKVNVLIKASKNSNTSYSASPEGSVKAIVVPNLYSSGESSLLWQLVSPDSPDDLTITVFVPVEQAIAFYVRPEALLSSTARLTNVGYMLVQGQAYFESVCAGSVMVYSSGKAEIGGQDGCAVAANVSVYSSAVVQWKGAREQPFDTVTVYSGGELTLNAASVEEVAVWDGGRLSVGLTPNQTTESNVVKNMSVFGGGEAYLECKSRAGSAGTLAAFGAAQVSVVNFVSLAVLTAYGNAKVYYGSATVEAKVADDAETLSKPQVVEVSPTSLTAGTRLAGAGNCVSFYASGAVTLVAAPAVLLAFCFVLLL